MVSSGLKTVEMPDAVAVLSGCGYWYAELGSPFACLKSRIPKWGAFLIARGHGTHAAVCGLDVETQFFCSKQVGRDTECWPARSVTVWQKGRHQCRIYRASYERGRQTFDAKCLQ